MRSKFFFRYRKQASRLHSRDFANCSDVGGGFGWTGWFQLLLGGSLLMLPLQQGLPVFYIPLVFQLFGLLRIFVGHSRSQLTTVLNDGLYLAFPPPITDLGPGLEET